MPDFNKGDFTQQGVNGHVNATVRLNEKRLVNIDLTSDEEAEGCTITGIVKDLLNDKVYNIGSGGGGGGIPLCSATINNTEGGQDLGIPGFSDSGYISIVPVQEGSTTAIVKLPYAMVGENVVALFNLMTSSPVMLEEESYATDLVNMTISEGMLIITDPTADSSVTLDGRVFAFN